MSETKILVQITVTRTVKGRQEAEVATVTGETETRGLNPAWLADKLGTVALRHLDRRYDYVAKRIEKIPQEATDNPPP